jgi:hypothetical protein
LLRFCVDGLFFFPICLFSVSLMGSIKIFFMLV